MFNFYNVKELKTNPNTALNSAVGKCKLNNGDSPGKIEPHNFYIHFISGYIKYGTSIL